MTGRGNLDLEGLLEDLRDQRGFDFTGYKRSSLARRITKRMRDLGIEHYGEYRDYLEVHADEFRALFDTILINVTSFFRDPEAWRYLQDEVIPIILDSKGSGEEIRIWSGGCSSGEEAFSLAIAFCEVMGEEAFGEQIKIYATDIDEDALRVARAGTYPAKRLESVDPALRDRYFEASGSSFVFRGDLRRRVIFGRHDITRDAPISRLDLLSCRNTLMYFNAETQAQILSRFHFALNQGGFLFLGKAEMLLSAVDLFSTFNMQHRVFLRLPGASYLPREPLTLPGAGQSEATTKTRRLREAALQAGPVAQLAVDIEGNVVLINNQARALFGLNSRDVRRPLRDLEVSYRPIELRSLIERALSERRVIRANAVERRYGADDVEYLDVQVAPVIGDDGVLMGTSITYSDVTAFVALQRELRRIQQELETANEELQSTNEELETTNEELQSSNEELETTNEELQSTNEELETTNEELQSSNEELETMNEELRLRSAELDEANGYLGGILSSLPVAVVVLDTQLDVGSWNAAAADLWGLREEEVKGHAFFGLDLLAPLSRLRAPIGACLEGVSAREEVELEGIDRRGRPVRCKVTVTPFRPDGGVVVSMEPIGSDIGDV